MNFLNLKAVLSLNGSGFALGLKRAESQSKQFAKEIKGEFARAFGTAAITAYGIKLVNTADNITDLSERLDIGTKALQEWAYAAQKSGSSIERVTTFLEALGRARERALGGDASDIADFASFGITDFSPNADQLARQMGRSLAAGGGSRNAMRRLGGVGAGELIPTLKSIDELSEAAHRAGRVLSDEMLEALKQMKNEAAGLADIFSGPMATALVKSAELIRNAMTSIKAGVAAGAAFFGGLSGGGIKEGWKAANAAFDEVFAEWEASQKRISERAANRAALGAGGAPSADKIHTIAALQSAGQKAAQSSMNPPGLTGWQSAGAAIRFNPDKKILQDIANATKETAQNTKPSQVRPASFNDLGGGFS